MEDKIKSVLDRVLLIAKEDNEFKDELIRRLNINSSINQVTDSMIKENISAIRSSLEIRGDKSINYGFIKETKVRDQLVIDNLRMENASLNLTEKEGTRFYAFCVNAFFQIENIINYYYFKKFPNNLNALLSEIEQETVIEKDYKFLRSNKEKNISDIAIAHKINAFCNTFFPNDKIKISISNLRQFRNNGEHRCNIIINEKDEENKLYRFYRYNTFDTIRNLLKRIVNEVNKQLAS